MYTTVTISAQAIRIGSIDSVLHLNEWGGALQSIMDTFEDDQRIYM